MATNCIPPHIQGQLDHHINQLAGSVDLIVRDLGSANAITAYVMDRLKDEFKARLVDNEFN